MSPSSQSPGQQAKINEQRSAPTQNKTGTPLPTEPDAFEEEVRRLAREMWPQAGGEGPVTLEGKERDGVFITPDTIHILEATTERRKGKAEYDIKKSIGLTKALSKESEYEAHNFKIWFITHKDPTTDQMSVARELRKTARCPVIAMSGRTF